MVNLIKASGEKQKFSEQKYRASLRRSGVDETTIDQVLKEVIPYVKEGTSTGELYKKTYQFLKKKKRPAAGRYSLKQGIMKLGPSGYPFEHFIADVLEKFGYKVRRGQTLQGKCVTHEIDVMASKGDVHSILECKYHNSRGLYASIQTSLYVKARFDDIKALYGGKKSSQKPNECWIVTNTRLSSQALAYAECVGLKVISWAYPKNHSLESLVEDSGLLPITCLTRLSNKDIVELIANDIVTCADIPANVALLRRLRFGESRIKNLVEEAEALCQKKGKS